MSARQEINAAARGILTAKLEQCTEAQQATFKRAYPKGVADHQIADAINLCNRTIAANARKASLGGRADG